MLASRQRDQAPRLQVAAPAGRRFVGFEKVSTTDGRTLSAFGQLIWKMVPQVEVTGGVRYIHETKDSAFV